MKKILYSVMALAIAAMTFTACEDVPEPYPTPQKGEKPVITYEGSGTLEAPYTVADAINYAKSFGQANSEQSVYIKGYITAITEAYTTNFGNATFEMSDAKQGGNKFTFYRGLYLGNKKYTANDAQIKVGDEVIVYGKVVNYRGNTPETVQGEAFLYALNGKTEGGGNDQPAGDAKGTGTLDDPFNAAAAIAYAKQVGDTESDKDVYIKGKVSSIAEQYGTKYGNATFGISDDGKPAGEFTVYRALYLGNQRYASGDLLQEGDEVIVCGRVTNFRGNTPETVQGKAYLYSLNGKTETGGDTPAPQPGGDVKAVTVAEFNAAEESTDVWYQLTGTVKNLKDNDQYGNFDLEDATGSVYVYGLLSEKGGAKKLFQQLAADKGITNGCKLTIIGNRGSYKGNIQVVNAYFASVEGGSDTPGDGGATSSSLLTNGDFESWSDGQPTDWKSASTASNATLSQSTDAHGGSYAVNINGKESSNVRLACKELKLEAGTYVFTFYAKATTADAAQVRPGYVPVTDGKVGSYVYGEYIGISNSSWTKVAHEFTLDKETTVCLVVMNPKKSSYSSGKDALVDDATLTKK